MSVHLATVFFLAVSDLDTEFKISPHLQYQSRNSIEEDFFTADSRNPCLIHLHQLARNVSSTILSFHFSCKMLCNFSSIRKLFKSYTVYANSPSPSIKFQIFLQRFFLLTVLQSLPIELQAQLYQNISPAICGCFKYSCLLEAHTTIISCITIRRIKWKSINQD